MLRGSSLFMAMSYLSEDKIREKGRDILGLYDSETALSGVGQLTSWKALGFKGIQGAPDGWYLPKISTLPAIVVEFKSNSTSLKRPQIDEIIKNSKILLSRYSKAIGILWNGEDIMVFKNCVLIDTLPSLQNKEYYFGLFEKNTIDQQRIYNLTKRINDLLHFKFGIKNLYHRMIFTACALVAKRYGAILVKGMSYNVFINSIRDTLSKSYEDAIRQNQKLNFLLDTYASIKMNITNNQQAIDDFIEYVSEISDNINSDFWNGEDVMAIFFNEFNRYKKKSEQGQVFTPDHITSLIYRITETTAEDRVLDAACGSGAFLVKAMCNMIKEVGGIRTGAATKIKSDQLFGIELDKEVFSLACANMLIHKDGKTNLEQLDSTSQEAASWIKSKKITRVLMNPPFENKYHCLDIVLNVLDNVETDAVCAFILPDKKLDKNPGKAKKILRHHTLDKIIKLPTEIFSGVTTSIFIFRAGRPHGTKPIFSCFIQNDGLITIKNQGRQDIKNLWPKIEEYWSNVIFKQTGDKTIQWINPSERLSYRVPDPPFSIDASDFNLSSLKYILYKYGIDEETAIEALSKFALYGTEMPDSLKFLTSKVPARPAAIDYSKWVEFPLSYFFNVKKGTRLTKSDMVDGSINYVGASAFNNGIVTTISNEDAIHHSGTLTVCYNGSIGETFYQTEEFWATDDVNVLYPKFEMNVYSALFFCSVIRQLGKIYAYNDKWTMDLMGATLVPVPVDNEKNPNFEQMESIVKGLPYAEFLID